jgi:mannose-6-phosphate isomerase class I
MYVLKPLQHETIWGGNRLVQCGKAGVKIGHLYLANGHGGMSNEILNGDIKGKTLYEAFGVKKNEWGLGEYDEFPLTVALVDASDDLSIQVHPDDETAKRIEGMKIGKTESWIFLSAPINGWIYGGCKCRNRDEVVQAISENRMDEVTSHLEVEENDCVTIQSGTLHSMTAGSLVYEVEYGSNFTYRFYDFNRTDSDGNTRELHVGKAVESIKTSRVPKVEKIVENRWLDESVYEIVIKKDISSYTNDSNEIEIMAILDGGFQYEGLEVKGGMGVMLLQGETVSDIDIKKCIIVRLKR